MKLGCCAFLLALGVCINSVASFSINVQWQTAVHTECSRSMHSMKLRKLNLWAKANNLSERDSPSTVRQSSRRDALFKPLTAAVVYALQPMSAQAQVAPGGPPQQEKMVGPGKDRNKIKVPKDRLTHFRPY